MPGTTKMSHRIERADGRWASPVTSEVTGAIVAQTVRVEEVSDFRATKNKEGNSQVPDTVPTRIAKKIRTP